MILALVLACRGRIHPADEHDAGPQWTSIEGTLDIDIRVDGFAVCDATVSFTGGPWVGECEGCEFAFEIEPVLERDEGTIACPWVPTVLLHHTGDFWHDPTVFALLDRNNGVPDEIMIGAGATDYGPELYFQEFADGDYGPVDIDGSQISWTLADDGSGYAVGRYPFYVNPCHGYGATPVPSAPFVATEALEASASCDPYLIDVFEFQGREGGTVDLAVDRPAGGAEFLPLLAVWSPLACTEGVAVKSFDCASGDGGCPALTFDTTAGRYLAAVFNLLGCKDPDASAAYRLDAKAAWDLGLAPVYDDLDNYGVGDFEISGVATLAE
jgi:hypothetical protein